MTHTTVPVIFDLDGTRAAPAGGAADGIAAARVDDALQTPNEVHTHGNV